MRELATIQRVNAIYPIEGKDRIVQYGINGWKVIDQIDRYAVGDLVVYLEVDSWVPNALAPFLSRGKEPRVFENIPGERLKTMKMGGAVSQGLLLPIDVLQTKDSFENTGWPTGIQIDDGTDVTEYLGVLLWEPSPEFMAANARGSFPHFIPKTDQTRIENMTRAGEFHKRTFEITEKLEGQSFTAYIRGDEVGMCSRNIELKLDEPSTWQNTFMENCLEAKLRQARDILGVDLAFQGEQVGPAIEGNIYGFNSVKLFIFKIWDITNQKSLSPADRRDLLEEIGLPGVPYVGEMVFPDDQLSVKDIRTSLMQLAYRKSALTPVVAEGLVFTSNSDEFSFKAVSSLYLLNDKKPTPWKD